jgi:hypothetical protein
MVLHSSVQPADTGLGFEIFEAKTDRGGRKKMEMTLR